MTLRSMTATQALGYLLFLAIWRDAESLSLHQPMGAQLYTTNSMCSKNRCINPVFPGLEDLHDLATLEWQCSTLRETAEAMSFCRGAINYDPALTKSQTPGGTLADRVRRQDTKAMTAFYYHLAGLGLEAWDYQRPELTHDDCIKSIWRMVCYTHFPRGQVGCTPGSPSAYMRPCQSSCFNYVAKCGVECCDESVQCVFQHTKKIQNVAVVTQGYAPFDGPSSLCTGAASRSGISALMLLPLLAAMQALLPGSQHGSGVAGQAGRRGAASERRKTASWLAASRRMLGNFRMLFVIGFSSLVTVVNGLAIKRESIHIPSHSVGNWRAESDYLIRYEFIQPGGTPQDGKLNSCSLTYLSAMLKCSGRGICRVWADDGHLQNHPATFCECDRDWADPECRTRRKSQATAYFLSLFLGVLGFDQFYLGYLSAGFLKLFTLGGCGIWWAMDVIRIGSAPVSTPTFRVAADFPHWAFVLVTVTYAMIWGFLIVYWVTITFRARRRRDALMLQQEEEHVMYKGDPKKDLATKAKQNKQGA
eukprot:TRINITY_DN21581_c0_g1_i1.p1 TRINITY_DN21581_c0_g1~~TRINITY_DN21581_c0_g1_i1.p1  ORF type:complete len:533 (-),score=78.91 TRINITY_DN21581_c0_g1_i1:120-1718(-)